MDEILDELDKAKGVHTRTASHIEFLYEQVQMIRDMRRTRKKPVAGRLGIWIAIIASVALFAFFIFKQCDNSLLNLRVQLFYYVTISSKQRYMK